MFEAATLNEYLHDMREYGFDVTVNGPFDWPTIKAKRDAYIQRLNGIYGRNLNNSKVPPKPTIAFCCSWILDRLVKIETISWKMGFQGHHACLVSNLYLVNL